MQINYFQERNKQSSNKERFGLCDDENQSIAYIDEENEEKWNGIVENKGKIEVSFYPIDYSLEIKRPNGEDSRKCEGILCYNNLKNIVFAELKDRKLKQRWKEDAIEQLKETIQYFFNNYSKAGFDKIECWIANKKHLTDQTWTQKIKKLA